MNKRKAVIIAAAAALAAVGVIVGIKLFYAKRLGLKEISKVNEELRTYKFGEYENLEFDCVVPEQDIEKLYTVTVRKSYKDFEDEQRAREILSDMVQKYFDITPEDKDIKLDDGALKYEYLENGETLCFAELFADGTFLLHNEEKIRQLRYEKGVTAKAPFISLSDNSKEVSLDGKSIDISDFEKTAEQEIRRCCTNALGGEDIVACDAVIMKSQTDGSEYLTLRFAHVIEGIKVNENGFAGTPDSGEFALPSFITVEMGDDKSVASIDNYYCYSIKEKKAADKIVPLSRANELLSQQLAPYYKNKVTAVELKYVDITEQGQEESELRPMWCYTLDEMSGGYGAPENFFFTQSAFVDAQTGDVYLCNSKEYTFDKHEFDG